MHETNRLPIDSLVSNKMIKVLIGIFKEYTFESTAKAIYAINSYLPNRNLLDLYITLNYTFTILTQEGEKIITNYKDFIEFINRIKSVYKFNPMNSDIQVHDFGEILIPFDKVMYKILVGTGHNHSFVFHYFIDEIAKKRKTTIEIKDLLVFNDELIKKITNGFDGLVEELNHEIMIPSEIHFNNIFKVYNDLSDSFQKIKIIDYFIKESHPNKMHCTNKNGQFYIFFNPSLIIDYIGNEISSLSLEDLQGVVNNTIQHYLVNSFELSYEQNHVLYNAFITDDPQSKPLFETIAAILLKKRIVFLINELNDGQVDKTNLEKKIKSIQCTNKLHLMAYYKEGFKVYPINTDVEIDFIYINNHINITKEALLVGKYGESITLLALDLLYFILRSSNFNQIINFIDSFKNDRHELISSDGLSGLFEITLKTEGKIEMGAIHYSSVLVDLYTPEQTILELYKNDFTDLPKMSNDDLFDNPFMWEMSKGKNEFIFVKRKGTDLIGMVRNNFDKGYVFICRNKEHFTNNIMNHEKINHIQTIDDLLSFMFDLYWNTLQKVGILNKGIQIFVIPDNNSRITDVGVNGYNGKYLKGDLQINKHHYILRIMIKKELLFRDILNSSDRSIEAEFFKEIFNVLDKTQYNFSELYDEIDKDKKLPKITNVGFIEIPYYKNDKNFSYWPAKSHFIHIRRHIALLCRTVNIKQGEYKLEEAKTVIRNLQNNLIPDFKKMIYRFYYLDLHVILLSLLSAIQFDIYVSKEKIFADDSMIDEKIAMDYKSKNISFRQTKKNKLRHLLYLIEFNLKYGSRDTKNKINNIDEVKNLLAYAEWFIVLQDNADTFHWKMDTSSIEITHEYLVNTIFTDDIVEKYKELTERVYSTGSFISDKIPEVMSNENLMKAFEMDLGFSFSSFIKVLGILSDQADDKEDYEINLDVIRFDSEKLLNIIIKDVPELHTKEKVLTLLNELTINTDRLSYIFKKDNIKDINTIPVWEREYRPNRFELKPLLLIGDSYIFSPIVCYQTLMLWSNSLIGLFPVHEYNIPNILKEIKRLKKITQDDMVLAISNLFKQKGYVYIFKELKLHKKGDHPMDLGDYDILVYDQVKNTVWNIESKVIQLVGSISEFAKQQDTFFNKDKNDIKFQKRIDYLSENIYTILKDLNLNVSTLPEIKNIMVTNKVFVSEYKKLDFSILAFGELKSII